MKFDEAAVEIAQQAHNATRAGNTSAAMEAQTRAILLLATAVNELVEQNRGVSVFRDCLLKVLQAVKR